MTKTADDVIAALADATKVAAWTGPARMMLGIPWEAINAEADELGWQEPGPPAPSMEWIAHRLGIDLDELYGRVIEAAGYEPVEDEAGEQDEDADWVPVTATTKLADLLERALPEPQGGLRDPQLGVLPAYFRRCEKCGKRGKNVTGSEEDEAAKWLVDRDVDPRGLEDLPDVEPDGDQVLCEDCADKRLHASEILNAAIKVAAERGYIWEDGTAVSEDDDEGTLDTWEDLVEDALAYVDDDATAGEEVERLVAGFLAAGTWRSGEGA